jgi:hypothetical protein
MKHARVATSIGEDAKRDEVNMSILASRATKSSPIVAATLSGWREFWLMALS